MFIHLFCLCPLGLTIKLNFDISKEQTFATYTKLTAKKVLEFFSLQMICIDSFLNKIPT